MLSFGEPFFQLEYPIFLERLQFSGEETAIVTGADRDLGQSIALEMAGRNIGHIVSMHRDEKKEKRASETINSIEDLRRQGISNTQIQILLGDLLADSDQERLVNTALEETGRLDTLVICASGPSGLLSSGPAINLARLAMKVDSLKNILFLQSVPSLVFPSLNELGMPKDHPYLQVAENKYTGQKALEGMLPEMTSRGIRFIVVCPPIVPGTLNVDVLFKAWDRKRPVGTASFDDLHNSITDRLKLPRKVGKDKVAERVSDLLLRMDVPQGYLELFTDLAA